MNDLIAIGMIRPWTGTFLPEGYLYCDGTLLGVAQHPALFRVIGNTFGGDGKTSFALPDLRNRIVVGAGAGEGVSSYSLGQTGGEAEVTLTVNQIPTHNHRVMLSSGVASSASPVGNVLAVMNQKNGRNSANVPAYKMGYPDGFMFDDVIGNTGNNQAHNNLMPYQTMKYIICEQGIMNPPKGVIGQIMMYAGNYPDMYLGESWCECDGRSLNTTDYPNLFQQIGYAFGGADGVFYLPDLRGQTFLGTGTSAQGFELTIGQAEGSERVQLTINELPTHNHTFRASSAAGQETNPQSAILASGETSPPFFPYTNATPDIHLNDDTLDSNGGDLDHNNIQPYCALHFMICLDGVMPSLSGNATDYIGMISIDAGYPDGNYKLCNGDAVQSGNNYLTFLLGNHFDPQQRACLLPDLRVAAPMGCNNMQSDNPGSVGGESMVVLTENQLPSHNHGLKIVDSEANALTGKDAYLASIPAASNPGNAKIFADPSVQPDVVLSADSIGFGGDGKGHLNFQPFIALNISICVKGIPANPT